jgi:mannitol/fructose-specific phosphotransferase system IIA component (Ntr-type)
MKIHNLIDPERLFVGLEADNLDHALLGLACRTVAGTRLSADEVHRAFAERERLGSTSVGGGFAIPHCKIEGIQTILMAIGSFVEPVDFADPRGELVRFVFAVVSPPDQPALHLQVLSQIARVLKNADVREELLNAPDVGVVDDVIRKSTTREGL